MSTPVSIHEEFRLAMADVATPVSVVASYSVNEPHGTTVSAFSSLSMHPPMTLVSLDRNSTLLGVIRDSGVYSINVLGDDQQCLAKAFARKAVGAEKFRDVDWYLEGGLPRLPSSPVWVSCAVESLVEGGDHWIVLGRVVDVQRREGRPLTYHARKFGTHQAFELDAGR